MDGPERRRLLIEAAESVFLESGYSAALTSDIARRACMSKRTLYRLFDSKEALFAAVIASRRDSIGPAPIGDVHCSDLAAVRGVLSRHLGQLARFILGPRQVALYRLVIAEAHRAPELSRAFYREGPGKALGQIAELLRQQNAFGTLRVSDSALDAIMLISMAVSELHMQLLIGAVAKIDDSIIEARVNYAVRLFFDGVARAENKMAGQERG
jgi:TetR/AcrR family transcriptional regulator, mexJK operon transcriptional repressor